LTFILGEYARDPKAHYTIKTGSTDDRIR